MKSNSTEMFGVKERMNTTTMKPLEIWSSKAKPSWIRKKNLPLTVQN